MGRWGGVGYPFVCPPASEKGWFLFDLLLIGGGDFLIDVGGAAQTVG